MESQTLPQNLKVSLILINRSVSNSIIETLKRQNRSFWILIGAVSSLLALSLLLPGAQCLFHFGNIELTQFLACIGVTVLSLVLLEMLKPKFIRLSQSS